MKKKRWLGWNINKRLNPRVSIGLYPARNVWPLFNWFMERIVIHTHCVCVSVLIIFLLINGCGIDYFMKLDSCKNDLFKDA